MGGRSAARSAGRRQRMRRVLDLLYRASGALAAACLVGICLIVVAQIAGRVIDGAAAWLFGVRFGLIVPSAAEFSGFLLAGATFLALAYTLRAGGHIRVTLLIRRLSGRARRGVELACLVFAILLSGFFAWNMVLLVADSWAFGEVSYGMIPVPLWIPQSAVAAGLIVLTIALIDEAIAVLAGHEPSYAGKGEALLVDDPGASGE